MKELLEAYRRTVYVVEPGGDAGPIEIRIGAHHPGLDRFDSWAVVTAFNPGSRQLPAEENAQRQAGLESRLHAEGLSFWPARGVPLDLGWEPETSVLVHDVSLAKATSLGRELGQVAVVFGRSGGAAELVLCQGSQV